MLKISQVRNTSRSTTLRVEGRVVGPWAEELRQAGQALLAEGLKIRLDLIDVSFADETGMSVILALKKQGVVLTRCSPFLAELLKH